MKTAVQAGEVELVLTHLPGCRCDLATLDPDATLVQLGCVTGYLVDGLNPAEPFGAKSDWATDNNPQLADWLRRGEDA